MYGPDEDGVAQRLERLIESCSARRRRRAHRISERDAWVIAYPDQFTDRDQTGAAGLDLLGESVAAHFGSVVTGIHVLPIHPWSSDGGFSVVDPTAVDESYGDWQSFSDLADRFDVMADAVINHLSSGSVWFGQFLAGEPDRRGWFKTVGASDDLSTVVRPRSSPLTTRFDRVDGVDVDVWTTFGADQVDLNYANPEVLLAMFGVVLEFVARGAVAVRLDAVAFLWKEPGTESVHLPATHATVALLRDCLNEIDPAILLVTETNVDHVHNVSYFGSLEVPEASAVYQFALPPLVLHALVSGDTDPLVAWAADLEPPPAGATFLNFLASHDGVGVRPARGLLSAPEVEAMCEACRGGGGVVNEAADSRGGSEPYELASTWFDLCSHGVDEADAVARHLASHAVMFAMQGVPLIYAHSLVGSSNDQEGFTATGNGRDLNRARLDPHGVADELSDPGSRAARIWSGMDAMLRRRSGNEAFSPSSRQIIHPAGPGLVVIERRAASGSRALVVVNLGGADCELELPPGRWSDGTHVRPDRSVVMVRRWTSVWLDGHEGAGGT